MKLVSRLVLFATVAAGFTFVSADSAEAQLFKRLFNRCCCNAEEPEPEPEACPCEAPEPCPAPEPEPIPCCAPAPEPMPCCAPEPIPMPCCEPAPAPEPVPMPCCEPAPAPAPCCGTAMLPTLGPGETLIAVYPLSAPVIGSQFTSPVFENAPTMIVEAPAAPPATEVAISAIAEASEELAIR